MSELSTSYSSNQKVAIVMYSDKMNHLTEQMFKKIDNLILSKKFYESQQILNLISLINPLSTIEHLSLYFYSFEISKNFFIMHKNRPRKKKEYYSENISSNSINNNIYIMKLSYCIKKNDEIFQ